MLSPNPKAPQVCRHMSPVWRCSWAWSPAWSAITALWPRLPPGQPVCPSGLPPPLLLHTAWAATAQLLQKAVLPTVPPPSGASMQRGFEVTATKLHQQKKVLIGVCFEELRRGGGGGSRMSQSPVLMPSEQSQAHEAAQAPAAQGHGVCCGFPNAGTGADRHSLSAALGGRWARPSSPLILSPSYL